MTHTFPYCLWQSASVLYELWAWQPQVATPTSNTNFLGILPMSGRYRRTAVCISSRRWTASSTLRFWMRVRSCAICSGEPPRKGRLPSGSGVAVIGTLARTKTLRVDGSRPASCAAERKVVTALSRASKSFLTALYEFARFYKDRTYLQDVLFPRVWSK